jgi:hypothetical protein
VDTPVHNPGSAFTRYASDLHASQSIARMNANAHYVAALDELGLNLFKRLVSDERIAVSSRSCGGKYVQPTRGNHSDPERSITGINQVDAHR